MCHRPKWRPPLGVRRGSGLGRCSSRRGRAGTRRRRRGTNGRTRAASASAKKSRTPPSSLQRARRSRSAASARLAADSSLSTAAGTSIGQHGLVSDRTPPPTHPTTSTTPDGATLTCLPTGCARSSSSRLFRRLRALFSAQLWRVPPCGCVSCAHASVEAPPPVWRRHQLLVMPHRSLVYRLSLSLSQELSGHGFPIYTNVDYIFKHEPPRITYKGERPGADYNPTGAYRSVVQVPWDPSELRVFLHIGAVTSAMYVWVNGFEVCYSPDTLPILSRYSPDFTSLKMSYSRDCECPLPHSRPLHPTNRPHTP